MKSIFGLVEEFEEKKEENPEPKKRTPEEMMGIAERQFEAYREDAFNVGRFEYYALSGNQEQLRAEDAPYIFESRLRYGSQYVNLGGFNHSWKLGRSVLEPRHYLEAYDAATIWAEKVIESEAEPVTLDEFYNKYARYAIVNWTREDGFPESFAVEDFPKEIAFRLFNQRIVGRDNAREYWKAYLEKTKISLEGFCQAALEDGNLLIALEGYSRIGMMDNSEVVAAIREEMVKLKNSSNPEDEKSLRIVLDKIHELKLRAEV